MTITELKDIAKSYGLIVKDDEHDVWIEVFFNNIPEFWDNENYNYPNKLIDCRNSYFNVYTKLRKTKSGKFVINIQKHYHINNYTPRRLHNLIKRIQKQIKVKLIAKRLEGIKQDF